MPAKIPDATMAKVLAEAEMFGDEAAVQRWEISKRSLTYYRKKEAVDPAFAAICAKFRRELNKAWAQNATSFLNKAITELAIRSATLENNAFTYTAIAQSIKIVGELKIDWDALNWNKEDKEEES